MEEKASTGSADAGAIPVISAPGGWDWAMLGPTGPPEVQTALALWIARQRWFGAKSKTIRRVVVRDSLAVESWGRLVLAELSLDSGPAEVYVLAMALATGAKLRAVLTAAPESVWARVESPTTGDEAVLYDGLADHDFCAALLRLFDSQARAHSAGGEIVAWQSARYPELRGQATDSLVAQPAGAEQSNSSVQFGKRLMLKVFRRVEQGTNPDLEISAYLTEHAFAWVPPLAGGIEYRAGGQEPWTLAMLQGFVPNDGDAWKYTLDWLASRLQEVGGDNHGANRFGPLPKESLCEASNRPVPAEVSSQIGEYLRSARRLGTRTAELHLTLAAETTSPAFAPQPFTQADGKAIQEQAHRVTEDTLGMLRANAGRLSGRAEHNARRVLAGQAAIDERVALAGEVHALRIRCHGDYHLGQVLVTGDDFVILDFEGEPARPLSQRREKRMALRDVAGMIRSFHYASCSAATTAAGRWPAAGSEIETWTRDWYYWTAASFLAAYRDAAGAASFLPASDEEFRRILDFCLLEKAVYELRYELNNRPDWVYLPLQAIVDLLGDAPTE